MKLHLSETEPKISLRSKDQNGNPIEKDMTYDSLLLTGALISIFHEGSVTVNDQEGNPIFDISVNYHNKN
ncbi:MULTISPECIES: hypothetical protein [Acinetobacter]|jgi:hypothetical protein|uniref:hypothetical protein n=1 Tax=Acinetobacter TaxID=469 RepID=UPI0018A251C8|nr:MULTISPECIES: hypothetical protein [Acinetobacter]MBF7690934.1 hypothetical protein [Acinetobacter pollinis]MBF7692923.1 hypothetical protein [Acinetobacter pollinis]MBF7698526.1 hypothetical protein [Acinetobacter pollinis]MBF7700498.1 hypothetical protein [Acinetobacter pollinis]WEV49925.1 hypothetical protein OZX61_05570 [Acinetobacter sp. ESL0695]